jgi:rubrerythrin
MGKRIAKGEDVEILPQHLNKAENNGWGSYFKRCSNCGFETTENFEYCPKCGRRF